MLGIELAKIYKKDPDKESNNIMIIPNAEEEPQKLETPQTTDLIDRSQIAESPNAVNDLDLLASFQKMKTEEQALLELKQNLLTTEQNLHTKLVEEIDKKKTAINNLKTEIPNLQNRCKELAQALGIPVYS